MIGTLIAVIIFIIILGIVWWAVQQLLPLIPMGEPFRTIIRVLLVVLVAFIALYVIVMLLEAGGISVPRLGRF